VKYKEFEEFSDQRSVYLFSKMTPCSL